MTREISLRDYVGATVLAAIVGVEQDLNADYQRDADEVAEVALKYADAYLKAAGTQQQPQQHRHQGPPAPQNERETPLDAEMWNLPKGACPEADDVGLCVSTNVAPEPGTLVRFKTKGGNVRTARTAEVLDKIENANGIWFVCTAQVEQPQQQTTATDVDAARPNRGFVGAEIENQYQEEQDRHQGQTPGQWNETPDPGWQGNPPPGAGGPPQQQDQRHQDVQRDVPAAPYKFSAQYDGDQHEGYGAKAFQEVEPGDWLLVRTDKGKQWPEIVTAVIRTTTLQGTKCWICATKKPPKNGNGGGNGHQQQRPGMWD